MAKKGPILVIEDDEDDRELMEEVSVPSECLMKSSSFFPVRGH
jgi:hypothetical protein